MRISDWSSDVCSSDLDYSADATLRSIEDSLKRLKTDRIEIVFVHDAAQDFYGDEWLGIVEGARKGAFKALDRLRDEGVNKAWGLGANRENGRASCRERGGQFV